MKDKPITVKRIEIYTTGFYQITYPNGITQVFQAKDAKTKYDFVAYEFKDGTMSSDYRRVDCRKEIDGNIFGNTAEWAACILFKA